MALRDLRGDGRGWTLLAIASGWVFVLGGRFLVPAVLPQVKATFGISDAGAGVAITIIWAAYGLMQSPGGLLIDRLGERRLLTGSLLLTAASVVFLGAAPAFLAFLVGCGIFGLATGLYGPARGTALSRTFPDHDGTAIGATLAAGSLGSAILPLAAGSLVETYSWRLIVGSLGVPLLIGAVLVWRTVPGTGGGAVGTAPRQRVSDLLDALRGRGVGIAIVATTLMTFAFQGVSAFLVTYLVSVKDLAQPTAAAIFSLMFISGGVAQLASGSLADRFGDRPVLVGVAATNIPVLAAIPFVDSVVLVALVSLLIGVRLGITSVSNAYIIAVLPDRVTGTAWGALRTISFMLAAGGSTFVGTMADAALFDEAFLLLAVLTAVAAVLYTQLPSRAAARAAAADTSG
ncbi:MFS transporter [Halonotius terrestris]|uniref:MFS transporter n=1 Tax=Halonotius terrestris TaxID=2487750 RepID=A0A8J8TC60_9EURY|nr:MFS transporter [Halonotius terrestris]TQQ79852.1 MFS transporter [Halonotius terrestris]